MNSWPYNTTPPPDLFSVADSTRVLLKLLPISPPVGGNKFENFATATDLKKRNSDSGRPETHPVLNADSSAKEIFSLFEWAKHGSGDACHQFSSNPKERLVG